MNEIKSDPNYYNCWNKNVDRFLKGNIQETFEAVEEVWMESKMQERNRIISIIKEVAGLRYIGDELIERINNQDT